MTEVASNSRPPLLKDHNYGFWKLRMKAYVRLIDERAWMTVEEGYHAPNESENGVIISQPRSEWSANEFELAKWHHRAVNAIFGGVDSRQFSYIQNLETAKEAWDALQEDKFVDFQDKLLDFANQCQALGTPISYERLNLKILRSLPKKFKAKVTAIEESKDVNVMSLDELLGSLQTFEVCLKLKAKNKGLALKTTVDSNVDDHQQNRLHFSTDRPCSFDCEVNVAGVEELHKYKSRFEIPDSVILTLPSDRAAWNPLKNKVAIYGAMLSCGVTLLLQPFIAKFLVEAQITPAQLAPNSYRILMCLCLCLMWKLKGFGPPTPREIHHFYTLRQAGNGGTNFLFSSAVENWIPEGVANPGQRWKNSWFFVGDEWGRDVPANVRRNLPAKKVPRHFTSPEAWSKVVPVLLDEKISHLAAAAVLPLDERGRSFLLDEEKMITQWIFPHLPARFPSLCDVQARAVKNFEAVSRRHAAGLAKEGFASLDGGDPSDGEDVGDDLGEGVETDQAPIRQEVAASTPSRKGKEKVGTSRVHNDIPVFDTNVPKTPLDPASDLNPRTGRGKRPAESTPDHAVRPPKWASRVVQYVVSSDEEGAGEPMLAEAALVQKTAHEVHVEGANSVVPPPSKGANDSNVPTPTPPRVVSPPAAASVAYEALPMGSTEANEGSSYVSLSDFSAVEICSHLINNDVYVGEGWEHVKGKSCNRKMEFFFNCHSLVGFLQNFCYISVYAYFLTRMFSFQMMSELVDNYRHENLLSRENKCLREQASILAAEKLSAEESYTQQLAQLSESADGYLFARLAVEEKLSAAKEEIRSLKEQLSASHDSLAAHLETKQLAEKAREKAEREAQDLHNQLSSRDAIFSDLKAVLELEAVDRFKKSPAYDVFLLREFERGMRQSKRFFAMKDHSNKKALRRFDKSLQLHMDNVMGSIKEQIKRWKAHCRYTRTDPHPMHLEVPTKRVFNTYYFGRKGSFSRSGVEPDLGPVTGSDYGPFMPDGDEVVFWPSEDEAKEDDEDGG
ncbi:hypothetical protein LWI29_018937 [Acer saccharum]|uniref:DUF4219 domain-containing protein n=1 Tax=Acer saccharum TaxID=4024 RepID=A0AA39V8E6_ACESA|nr:hypothetical protein LWI29_018937 [Acer saccharum]